MGTVYHGPYANLIDAYHHEGYAARKLPTGLLTSTWSYATREFRHHVAKCGCGWTGSTLHPPTEQGEQDALEEWDRKHLQVLIRKARTTWRPWADRTARAVHEVADLIGDGQHHQAAELLSRLITRLEERRRIAADLANPH
jgi:hypothetical protein